MQESQSTTSELRVSLGSNRCQSTVSELWVYYGQTDGTHLSMPGAWCCLFVVIYSWFKAISHKALSRGFASNLCVWCGVVWCGVVWCGVVWCAVAWRSVAWCGVVWCGVVWCGVVWCGVITGRKTGQ